MFCFRPHLSTVFAPKVRFKNNFSYEKTGLVGPVRFVGVTNLDFHRELCVHARRATWRRDRRGVAVRNLLW